MVSRLALIDERKKRQIVVRSKKEERTDSERWLPKRQRKRMRLLVPLNRRSKKLVSKNDKKQQIKSK